MDNIDKLIEAVEHPDSFSEAELNALLSDPETLRLYRLLCASRSDALASGPPPSPSEIDARWKRFKRSRRRNPFLVWISNRKVAAVAAVLIASCSIIVVGVSLSNRRLRDNESSPASLTEAVCDTLTSEKTVPDAMPAPKDTVIIFEDDRLDMILAEIAPYYNARVDLQNPRTKDVRLFLKWESSVPLDDLIDHLNSFDRINLFLKEDVITDY